jgi:putative ABC transport system permease protein
METINQFKTFSYIISTLVLLVGGLVVLVTMMGSVRERTEEIGIFRAIGYRRKHVMQIIFQEALMISSVAGVLGFLGGTAISWGALRLITDYHDSILNLDFNLAAIAIGLSITVGIAAGTYPALMASRMDPNEALRAI